MTPKATMNLLLGMTPSWTTMWLFVRLNWTVMGPLPAIFGVLPCKPRPLTSRLQTRLGIQHPTTWTKRLKKKKITRMRLMMRSTRTKKNEEQEHKDESMWVQSPSLLRIATWTATIHRFFHHIVPSNPLLPILGRVDTWTPPRGRLGS